VPFYHREDELAALAERWASRRGEFFVLYGRRRVWKSELLLRSAQGRRALYFEATSGSRQDHLDDLSGLLAELTGRELFREQPLTNWRAAFAAIGELLGDGPIMIILDEFQFVARKVPEAGSLLNRFMRSHDGNPNLLLCIADSDVSFFESKLREEPIFLLSQESRINEIDTYMSCLRAIAAGITSLNEIAMRVGRTRSEEARPFLATLEELGPVERPVSALLVSLRRPWREPACDPRGRRALPVQRDHAPARRVHLRGRCATCQRSSASVSGGDPFAGVGENGNVVVLGSCKWPDATTPDHVHRADELDKLETIRAHLDAPAAQLLFFDRVAFSPRLHTLATERDDVRLVPAEALRGIEPQSGRH
jgi:AAA+ ATPase superfamily predicted ATPase